MSTSDRERLALMADSDNVKLRDVAVIGTTLMELEDQRDAGEPLDFVDAAKAIIAAQARAGLGTFVLADLNAFIADMKQAARSTSGIASPSS